MAKRKFNIYISAKTDEEGVAYARLANIKPVEYEGNDLINKINDGICTYLVFNKYSHGSVPSAEAIPSPSATPNKEFGEKLARKRVLRRVYGDVREYIKDQLDDVQYYVAALNTMLDYADEECASIDRQINRMYMRAAEAEDDIKDDDE